MIPLWFVLFVFVCHFVGDFLLQTNWMAINKSKENKALLLHGITYILPFLLLAVLPGLSFFAALFWIVFNSAAHMGVDYVTSRLTTRLWFVFPDPKRYAYVIDAHKRHWFFVVIGLDQSLHFAIMIVSAGLAFNA